MGTHHEQASRVAKPPGRCMELTEYEFTLSTGEKARYSYDKDENLLEIIFRQAEASCAVELTESIILRFYLDTSEPLSLSFSGRLHSTACQAACAPSCVETTTRADPGHMMIQAGIS
jgi:hypothetical protein